MKSKILVILMASIVVGICFLTTLAQSQEPGPEHKRLGFWVGIWNVEAEAKPNPLFPGGKYSATMTGEWFEGNFHVVCRYKWTGAMGPYTELNIIGYDAAASSYYIYVIDGFGGNQVFMGTMTGNVWTYVSDMKVEGKPAKFRWTIIEVSPTIITWKSEISIAGGPWILAGEAKANKI
jgi:hypothetical protein